MSRDAKFNQNADAQNFWLDNLGKADNFNHWVFDTFQQWLQGEVLELGCGTGNFTVLIAEQGYQVTGLDINPHYIEIAKHRLRPWPNATVRVEDINCMRNSQQFDTIILLDVLEHIEDDVNLLRFIALHLRPGGRLILKVPAIPALYSNMDNAIGHYRRYNQKMLEAKLTEAGIKPLETNSVNSLGIFGWWLNGKVLKRETPPAMQVNAFNWMVPMAARTERLLRIPFGLSLISLSLRS